jgi:hypothetical protein
MIGPKGPLFGLDFVEFVETDEDSNPFALHIYPDAANAELKAAGLTTHYYYVPQRIFLAKKVATDDFDFGATIFKHKAATNGKPEIRGGFCKFSTTFGIPPNIIQKVTDQLMKQDFNMPDNPDFAKHFNVDKNVPRPRLGIVNIVDNEITVEILQPGPDVKTIFIDAQGQGKGSIEAAGISSFLVTLSQLAADIISRSLQEGRSPFVIHYTLKEQFYVDLMTITVHTDVKKVHKEFSAAFGIGGTFSPVTTDFERAYKSCITSGAITTNIKMGNTTLPEGSKLKEYIDTQCEDMMERCYEIIKKEIFDWVPTSDPPANADGALWNRLLGGAKVSLKAKDEVKEVRLVNEFTLEGSMTINDTKSGNLDDLESAIKSHPEKYFSVIDADI